LNYLIVKIWIRLKKTFLALFQKMDARTYLLIVLIPALLIGEKAHLRIRV